MLGKYSFVAMICVLLAVQSTVFAQGITFLIKGKVIDSKRKVL